MGSRVLLSRERRDNNELDLVLDPAPGECIFHLSRPTRWNSSGLSQRRDLERKIYQFSRSDLQEHLQTASDLALDIIMNI